MQLTVNIKAASFLAALQGKTAALQAALVRVMTRLSIEVQRGVKETKLTGQVLHVRTGTLRRSINRRVIEQGGSVMASVGTNVSYAAAHEYGFKGEVDVREHVRKTRGGTEARVRAHTRKVVMPERSFLRSTVDDMGPHIKTEIRKAVLQAVRL